MRFPAFGLEDMMLKIRPFLSLTHQGVFSSNCSRIGRVVTKKSLVTRLVLYPWKYPASKRGLQRRQLSHVFIRTQGGGQKQEYE